MSLFTKATKKQSKLRLAIFGPSGSGKTYTALSLAKGIAGETGKVALIDTERDSASLYADRFNFDHANLPDFSTERYIQFIQEAKDYDVLVIDSITHAWQSLLEEVDKLANAKFKGNTWAAWSEGTPMQRKLVDTLLNFPGHIIATMRSKTEWQASSGENGKSRPTRVGLSPEQGKGIEYEFTLLMELTTDHLASIIKDRTGKFQDKMIEKPGEKFGLELVQWLNSGIPTEFYTALTEFSKLFKKDQNEIISGILEKREKSSLQELKAEDFGEIIQTLNVGIEQYNEKVKLALQDTKKKEFFVHAQQYADFHKVTLEDVKIYVKTIEGEDAMNDFSKEQFTNWSEKLKATLATKSPDGEFLLFLNSRKSEKQETPNTSEPAGDPSEANITTTTKMPY